MTEPDSTSSPRPNSLLLVAVVGGLLFWALALVWGLGWGSGGVAGGGVDGGVGTPHDGPLTLDTLAGLTDRRPAAASAARDRVFEEWDPRFTAPLLDYDYLGVIRGPLRGELMAQLAEAWNVTDARNMSERRAAIQRALWAEPVEPPPGYAAWKAELYSRVDRRFAAYFDDFTESATVRLDEVLWGGVRRDGIPPLINPEVSQSDGPAADYLDDGDVVFGVSVNGEARAYPKRILAWHEMVKDRLGDVPINGVYCTLCGSMIVYDTLIGGEHHELGTSGFLYRSNKLMYDRATESLWSTLTGEPVIGPLVGRGLKLTPRTLVTTTWGRWKARHPQTTVLTVNTGHRRDYGEGAAYRDYFATDDLMFPVPRLDHRLRNKSPVLALRIGEAAAGPVALSSAFLSTRPVYAGAHGGQAYVVLTDVSGAHRVYDPRGVSFKAYDGDRTATDADGGVWTLSEDALVAAGGTSLPRLPSHNAFWFGWHAAHPDTELIAE